MAREARRRRRRRRPPEVAVAEGRYRWFSAPIALAFGVGAIVGMVITFLTPIVGFALLTAIIFLTAFSVSHLVGRRLRRRAGQRRVQQATSPPHAPQQSQGPG